MMLYTHDRQVQDRSSESSGNTVQIPPRTIESLLFGLLLSGRDYRAGLFE